MIANLATTKPPAEISVGGFPYKIDYDFLTWIEVVRMLRDFVPNDNEANHELLCEIQTKDFGGVLKDENEIDVLNAISEFAKGYPSAPTNRSNTGNNNDAPSYSFEYDLNLIIIAIRNQSGIDLSYRRTEKFHWWEFLLEFETLCGDHFILRLMEIRSYNGKDTDMIKQRNRHTLPRDLSKGEQVALNEINVLFYNC